MNAFNGAEPIRWLHLSDFHVGKDEYAQGKMFDYIVKHVSQRKADGFAPDFIFLTGDLANKGKSLEYERFWLEFVSPLQEIIGDGIAERTFAVAGNHDVDREKHPAFDRVEMAAVKNHYFDNNEEGQVKCLT